VVNSHLACDPTIRQPGFDIPRQQWSLLNRFRTDQGHCGACRRKWRLTDTDLCPCGETQTMCHIVESCPLTKLNGALSRLHSADEDAVSWLTSYGSWNAYEKKRRTGGIPCRPDLAATLLVNIICWIWMHRRQSSGALPGSSAVHWWSADSRQEHYRAAVQCTDDLPTIVQDSHRRR